MDLGTCTKGVERPTGQSGKLANPDFVLFREVGVALLVRELKHSVPPTVFAAHCRGEPSAHWRMLSRLISECVPLGVRLHFGLGHSHDVAGRDRDSVQAESGRILAILTIRGVLGAEAEVLTDLRRVINPQFERGLLGTGQRTRKCTRALEERVQALARSRFLRGGGEERRDLRRDFTIAHSDTLTRQNGSNESGIRRIAAASASAQYAPPPLMNVRVTPMMTAPCSLSPIWAFTSPVPPITTLLSSR